MFTKQNEKSKCGLSNPNTEEGVFFQGGMQDELFGKTSGQPILRPRSPNTQYCYTVTVCVCAVAAPTCRLPKRQRKKV